MCVICYSPAGTTPTESQLVDSNRNNPDGFGWAVRTPNEIVRGHCMNGNEAIDRFLDLRSRYPDHDAMYHARITTHGGTELSNCHPFEVGDSRTVLAHNGMLDIVPAKGDGRSDTKIFAEDVLTRKGLGVLDRAKNVKKLERWMSGSKMVIMTNRPDMLKDTYILNEEDGVWDEGLWFSNGSYRPYIYKVKSGQVYGSMSWELDDLHGYTDAEYLDEGHQCYNPECGVVWDTNSESAVGGICRACEHCMDCGENAMGCFCYTPNYKWWETEKSKNRGVYEV